MRFLVTGIGGPAGRALIPQLACLGHEIYGVDMAAFSHPQLYAFEQVPPATDPAMLDALYRIITQHDIDAVIPTVAEELTIIADAQDRFAPTPVVIGHPHAVAWAHDKYLTMQQLDAAGVATPTFALPSDFDAFSEALQFFHGVFAMKPRVGRGSRGFRVITKTSQLDWASIDDSTILQAFAPGKEYAPNVFRTADHQNTTVVVLEKQPHGIRRCTQTEAPAVASLASDAVAAMDLVGPVDIDIRINHQGLPVVLEVNARFGANSAHAPEILQGVLADLAVG